MLVDFHTHILPGIDDGSASVEESIALLKLEAQQGVTTVVATPHFYPETDSPDLFLQRRDAAYALLMEAIANEPGLPQIVLGAEVKYFRGISNCETLSDLQIGKSGYVLVEMPYGQWPSYAYRELEELEFKQGLTPIIAHVDRYLVGLGAHKLLKTLSQMPVLLQANANFFLYPSTKNKALRLLKKGQIQLLGSDCHNLTDRTPNLAEAITQIKSKLGDRALDYVHQVEKIILS